MTSVRRSSFGHDIAGVHLSQTADLAEYMNSSPTSIVCYTNQVDVNGQMLFILDILEA